MLDRSITLCFMPQWSINQPPIGIAYLTAYLERHDFRVQQRDLSIEMFSELPEDRKFICESAHHENFLDHDRFFNTVGSVVIPFIDRWAKELAECSSPFIGFTILSSNKIPTVLLLERLKALAPHKVVIVGGPHCTRYEGGFELAANPHVDYVVPDEGEEVLLEMLELLSRKGSREDMKSIPGILFLEESKKHLPPDLRNVQVNKGIWVVKDDRIYDTGERELIKQINDLPMPVFDGFKLDLYKQVTIPILGSRGCIYKCTFCSETVLWKRFRYRTGDNLFEEFRYQREKNGIRSFYIVDSLINGNIKELERFCDLIIENGLEVYWGGKASIRTQMTKELLNKMYKAGCRNLDYGIESGSPKILKDMKKGFEIPTATRVLKDSTDAGIVVGIFMMVGFPTETVEDYKLSKRFMFEHRNFIAHVTPGYGFGVQPGSDTYINQEKYGIKWENGNWYSEHVTPEILQFRVNDFRAFCRNIGIKVSL